MKKNGRTKSYDDIQRMLDRNKYITKTKKVVRDRRRASKIYVPPPTFIEIYDTSTGDESR